MFTASLIWGMLQLPATVSVQPRPIAAFAAAQGEGNSTHLLMVSGGQIEVTVHLAHSGLTVDDVLSWVQRSAEAVVSYYGQFPVYRARVIVTQSSDGAASIHGTTWGNVQGVQGLTRMRLGTRVTESDLDHDWTMTHELVHMALTSLPDDNHWLDEGLATYVEPIARAQAGQLSSTEVWKGMIGGMQNGEPLAGDRGLDQTHTWGRTYWGGALFSLVADIEIRKTTSNRKSLQDALRAIVKERATIDTERPLIEVLRIGDRATGTTVLESLYADWKYKPVVVNLDSLWLEFGVQRATQGIVFDDNAPLANIRKLMTQPVRVTGSTN